MDAQLERIAAHPRRPLLVGIDGPGGSGKSTLARRLAGRLEGAVVIEGDDFYRDQPDGTRAALDAAGGYERYFDWERLRDEVLVPVREGHRVLRHRRYDWERARLGARVEQPMPDIVIVEGVYTLRPQLAGLVDLKVFVATDEATRLRRQLDRGENSEEWIARWMAAEDHYLRLVGPERSADLVIPGR
jgi:uridine kinase